MILNVLCIHTYLECILSKVELKTFSPAEQYLPVRLDQTKNR